MSLLYAYIKGVNIADAALSVGHNVTLSELEFFQIFYEILMQCTGILARDQHGHIVHGRNMDIGKLVYTCLVACKT